MDHTARSDRDEDRAVLESLIDFAEVSRLLSKPDDVWSHEAATGRASWQLVGLLIQTLVFDGIGRACDV